MKNARNRERQRVGRYSQPRSRADPPGRASGTTEIHSVARLSVYFAQPFPPVL